MLPESLRGFWGYSGAARAARDPRTVIDLLVPTFFGRPDRNGFWGEAMFGGHPPLYFSLFPGLVALALAGAAGRPRGRDRAAGWVLALAGALLAFSGGRLLAGVFESLPGGSLFRYPEKFFLWPALGLALAAGTGAQRLLRGEGKRNLARCAGLLALPMILLWLGFGAGGGRAGAWARSLWSPALDVATYDAEHLRWAGLAMIGVATLVATLAAAWAARRHPVAAVYGLLVTFAGSQAFFLAPSLPTDDAGYYRRMPALAAEVDRSAVVVQGGVNDLFGPGYAGSEPGAMPDDRYFWLERRAHDELYGFAGMAGGRRYEFNFAPEGLDEFVVYAVASGIKRFDDTRRIAVLRATGVDELLLHRPLGPEDAGGASLVAAVPGWGRTMRVYRIPAPLPEAELAGDVVFAPNMNAGFDAILAPGFDPRTTAVVAGSGPPRHAPAGTILDRVETRERVEVEVHSPAGGYLILRRAYLPIWRATIDAGPARPVIAQMTRLAVAVPPGRHRVRLWIPRTPLHLALLGALLGVAGLIATALVARRDTPGETAPPPPVA